MLLILMNWRMNSSNYGYTWICAPRIPHQATSWDQRGDVGTHRWSQPLWISKWILNWTQSPRIPHSSHLGKKFSFELLLIRMTDQNSSAFLVLSLLLYTLYSFDFLSSRAPLHLPPQSCLSSRSLFLGLTAAESCKLHLQQAQRTSPHCRHKVLPVFQISWHQQLRSKTWQLTSQPRLDSQFVSKKHPRWEFDCSLLPVLYCK